MLIYELTIRLPFLKGHNSDERKLVPPNVWVETREILRDLVATKYTDFGLQLEFKDGEDGRKEIVIGAPIDPLGIYGMSSEKMGDLRREGYALLKGVYQTLVSRKVDPTVVGVKDNLQPDKEFTLEDIFKRADENSNGKTASPT